MTLERAPQSANKMTYDEALLYCLFYEYNGKRGWRLPTQSEYVDPRSWVNGETEPTRRKFFCSPVRSLT